MNMDKAIVNGTLKATSAQLGMGGLLGVAIGVVAMLAGAAAGGCDAHAAASLGQPKILGPSLGWQTYVFVSTRMPRQSLVDLAREASMAQAILVLRGFDATAGQAIDLGRTQKWVGGVNELCCAGKAQPHWVVDPRLFATYAITAAPSFVLAWPGSTDNDHFVTVTGDMALASALKFIAQQSKVAALRSQAGQVYRQAFGARP